LSIASNPANGSAHVNKKNKIRYTPKKGFVGTEKFSYQIEDKKGAKSKAMVTIQVRGIVSPSPIAEPDTATVKENEERIWISVLSNDKNLKNTPIKLSIASNPANGSAHVNKKNKIRYTPKKGFRGKDELLYKIIDGKNQQAIATVTIDVKLSNSKPNNPPPSEDGFSFVSLGWSPVSSEKLGYIVYFGPTSGMLNQQLLELPIDSNKWNRNKPSGTFNIAKDLHLQSGEMACFAVQAYNDRAKSELSKPICKVIP
jgi:hypothetical protein